MWLRFVGSESLQNLCTFLTGGYACEKDLESIFNFGGVPWDDVCLDGVWRY